MTADHYLIIGNGVAANQAAEVLREGDAEGRITLVSNEFFPFYYRHRLRSFVAGEIGEDELAVRSPDWYRERNIRLRLGQTVTAVDLEKKIAYLKHMEKVTWTTLLLCCGGRPRIPEIHYGYRQHFTVLKGLRHARAWRARLPELNRILIVGGDLISVRVAETLLGLGKEVLFMIDDEAFWPLEVTEGIRAELAENLAGRGAEIISGDAVTGIAEEGAGYRVSTRRGAGIVCDLVGAFYGLVPAVDFLFTSGLDIDRGILVDEYLRAGRPDVWAAGDCAQVYNPAISNYWVSIGWENARRLGEVAARNILGAAETAVEPPVNALTYEGVTVQTAWWKKLD